jgi:hypothetical protein
VFSCISCEFYQEAEVEGDAITVVDFVVFGHGVFGGAADQEFI